MLVTTLTKKMAEDLSEYLANINIKVHYLHSDIKTLERLEILRDLRLGVYDVVVGINLLREGLDLPEVSLVAILDADKEGFLRSRNVADPDDRPRGPERRAARCSCTPTSSPARWSAPSVRPTAAARIQVAYNEEHGITPESIQKTDPGRDPVRARLRAPAIASPRMSWPSTCRSTICS